MRSKTYFLSHRAPFYTVILTMQFAVSLAVSASVNSGAANHHLFVGVDLFLEDEDSRAEVISFDGERIVTVNAEGETDAIKKSNGFNFQRKPKVSSTMVQIDDLTAEAIFSPHTDPQRDWLKTRANLTASLVDQANVAQGAVTASQSQVRGAPTVGTDTLAQASLDTQVSMATESMLNDSLLQLETTFNANPLQLRAYAEERESKYDAVEIRCSVSSPEPIANAQMIALVTIMSGDEEMEVTFHRHVGRIGPEPRKITLSQINLPPGFEIQNQQIHVFNGRAEIATNLSPKHTALSRDFATKYAQLDYLGENAQTTAPAAPVWGLAPAELRGSTNVKEIDFPVTVDLDAEGSLVAIQDTGTATPSHIKSIVSEMAFLPALEAGQPVASTLEINLADYFR